LTCQLRQLRDIRSNCRDCWFGSEAAVVPPIPPKASGPGGPPYRGNERRGPSTDHLDFRTNSGSFAMLAAIFQRAVLIQAACEVAFFRFCARQTGPRRGAFSVIQSAMIAV